MQCLISVFMLTGCSLVFMMDFLGYYRWSAHCYVSVLKAHQADTSSSHHGETNPWDQVELNLCFLWDWTHPTPKSLLSRSWPPSADLASHDSHGLLSPGHQDNRCILTHHWLDTVGQDYWAPLQVYSLCLLLLPSSWSLGLMPGRKTIQNFI